MIFFHPPLPHTPLHVRAHVLYFGCPKGATCPVIVAERRRERSKLGKQLLQQLLSTPALAGQQHGPTLTSSSETPASKLEMLSSVPP